MRLFKHLIITVIALINIPNALAAGVTFSGAVGEVINLEPDSRSGLDALYVARSVNGLSISFQSDKSITWWRFGAAGGAYAEQIHDIEHAGSIWTLKKPQGNMGYMIEIGESAHYYFWLVDYSAYPFEADGLQAFAGDCGSVALDFAGKAERMTYSSITGRAIEIDRGIEISFMNAEWNAEENRYMTVSETVDRAWVGEHITLPAPYVTTSFTLNGDRFLRAWGAEQSVVSGQLSPQAIDATTSAEQDRRENDNEQSTGNEELGGSAPVDITFRADVTEAAIFNEWQFARDPDFDRIDYRSNDLIVDYTFREMGTTYVRFIAANADASCDYVGDTYTIFVGESDLTIPNAFSPGSSEGVNDVWKVSYKSLVKFECHIFNKWGEKLAEFTDPAQGWDGKYRGKVVPAGVYYYVIKAVGADGRKYNRSGDINIVNYR